jgi:signal transduction histidine kinase
MVSAKTKESLNKYLTFSSSFCNTKDLDLGQMDTLIDQRLGSPTMNVLRQDTMQSMVHDMRAPMTVLKGYLQILLSGMMGEMKEDQRKLIAQSVAPLEELILLTDNMLQAVPLEDHSISLTPTLVDLDLLISEVIGFYELPFNQRSMRLTRALDARGLKLSLDPFWTKRVLHNLIWNAYKFTADGGEVALSVMPHEHTVDIVIQDSGRGIPADKIHLLFDKFTQCSAQDRKFGTGLGLWICQRVMELHGGSIHVESEIGCGSRFILTFPA